MTEVADLIDETGTRANVRLSGDQRLFAKALLEAMAQVAKQRISRAGRGGTRRLR